MKAKWYLEPPARPPFLWQAAPERKNMEVMVHNLRLLEFLNPMCKTKQRETTASFLRRGRFQVPRLILPSSGSTGFSLFFFFWRMCTSHSFQSLPAAPICLSLTLVDPLKSKWSDLSVPRDTCSSLRPSSSPSYHCPLIQGIKRLCPEQT